MSKKEERVPGFYITGNEKIKAGIDELNLSLSSQEGHALGFTSISDNTTVTPPFTRTNYENYRPQDAIPKDDSSIMIACRNSYEQVGLIRSVIDLMTEIAVEGLELVSDNESTQNFYNAWAKKVNLLDRAERFANYYLVEGNVVVRRKSSPIDTPTIRKMRRKATANHNKENIPKGEIPVEYLFYDPATIELIGEELAVFTGKKSYGIKVSANQLVKLQGLATNDPAIKKVISSLPQEIKDLIEGKRTLSTGRHYIIPIPAEKLYIDHYKKRDSAVWAKSFIYSILPDVVYNDKLRLAKISGLDSWNSVVRIWKVGDHKAEIFPDSAALTALANVLQNNSGPGSKDIIWDSLLEYEDHYPPVDKLQSFDENYESILLGLGVHRSLIGGGDSTSGGVTNAFVGLRNMMKRIDAVRRAIVQWINHEIEFINESLGFQNVPKIKFSLNNLFDQQAYFKLLVDMNDRDVISNQSLMEKIGEDIDIEKHRIDKEKNDPKIPEKKGQFVNPFENNNNQEKKIELLDHQAKLENDKMDKQFKQQKALTPKEPAIKKTPEKPKGKAGRPAGSKDEVKRNRKFRSKADLLIHADSLQAQIDNIVDEYYLGYNKIANKRQLTTKHKNELEGIKLEILASADVDKLENFEDINKALSNSDKRLVKLFKRTLVDYKKSELDLTAQQLRMIKNIVYSEVYGND